MKLCIRYLTYGLLSFLLIACDTGRRIPVQSSLQRRPDPPLPEGFTCTNELAGFFGCPPVKMTEEAKAAQEKAIANFISNARIENEAAELRRVEKYYQPAPANNLPFVDALDKFRKYNIPSYINTNTTFWLDNDRIAVSLREYPGWKADPDERSRIVSYNFVNKELADSGHRGRIHCLNHLGEILVARPDKGSGQTLKLREFKWFAGKWGQPLKQIEYVENPTFSSYHCSLIPYGDPIYRDPPEKLKPDAAIVTPLMPQHGAIKETVVRIDGKLQDKVFLIKPDGSSLYISSRRPNRFYFLYKPWDESYFEVNTGLVEPRSFYPSGEIVSHPIPPLLIQWKKVFHASVAPFPSRAGIVWAVQQHGTRWRMQGLFLQQGDTLLRIEDGYPMGDVRSSPDGCRIYSSGLIGDFYAINNKPYSRVIDLCKENLK